MFSRITERFLERAREAVFDHQAFEGAQVAHKPATDRAEREGHAGPSSRYLGPVVYGALDGIITTFAIVSGVAGAALGSGVILILGLANLFADGVSMATGAYLSARSEKEYYRREREREQWEVEHIPEGECAKLSSIFRRRGYSRDDAQRLVDIECRRGNRDRLVDTMLVYELNLLPDERRPQLIALATLGAFVVAGTVPLLAYLAGLFVPIASGVAFEIAISLTAAALFAVGAARVLVTERNWLRSGLEMLVVGGLAAGVAYLVGYLLRGLGG